MLIICFDVLLLMRRSGESTITCPCFSTVKKTVTFSLSCLLLHFKPNQLTQFGWRRRRASSLSLSAALTCPPPFSPLCVLCFPSRPRTRHTFQLLYSTVVTLKSNRRPCEDKNPKRLVCELYYVEALRYLTLLLFSCCTLALLNSSRLCVCVGGVCASNVFHWRMCEVCLFVGQDGRVVHPVTLIPSET